MDSIVYTIGASLAEVADEAMAVIGSVLPYALTVVGAILVVTIGIRVFKKIAGK